jgi:type VI secretion system secreted protein Hcp
MASDYLLEIDGIKGESHDSKHKGTIEISSFSWGASQGGTHGSGGGGGAGKVSFQDLHFTSTVNIASPKLAEACATGKHLKKAVLYVRKAGGKQEEYYKVTLSDVLVSNYQLGGQSKGSVLPVDQFSLNFAKIEYEYKPQKQDGSLDAGLKMVYDLAKNTAG